MMIWQVYLFIALLAFALSAISFASDRLHIDAQVGASGAAFLLWTLWGLSSYNVETITNTGTVVTSQYEALVIMGIIAAAMMLIWTIWNIMRMFGMDPDRLMEVRL